MKVIRLYQKYFFSTSNVIIMILLQCFLICSFIISITNLNDGLSYSEILKYYFENGLYYSKFILILFSSFIFMKLNSERNEYILNIVIAAGYTKKRNYKLMILSNLMMVILYTFICFVCFIIIGFIFKDYFILKINYIISFFNILLLCIYYSLLSYLLTQIIKNQFVYILLIILFFISELFVSSNDVIKYIYLYFFPNVNNVDGFLYVNTLYLLIIIIMLYFFNQFIYLNKDLKN